MPTALQRTGHGFPGLIAPSAAFDHWIRGGCGFPLETSAAMPAEDELWAAPMLIPGGTSFDRVGFYCGATGAGNTARMGLYNSDPVTGGPGSLLRELATLTLVANSNSSATIDLTVHETALYWLATQFEDGAASSAPQLGGGLMRVDGGVHLGTAAWGCAWGYKVTGQTPSSLADPFPASPTPVTFGPLSYFRVSDAPPPLTALRRNRHPWAFWGVGGDYTVTLIQPEVPGSGSSLLISSDALHLRPFFLQEDVEVQQIGTAVTSVGTGTYRMGLYDGNDDGAPRRLLDQSGAFSCAIIQSNSWVVNQRLRPGLYWVALRTDASSAANFYGHRADGLAGFSVDEPSASVIYPSCGINVTPGGAGLPDPCPAPSGGFGQIDFDFYMTITGRGRGPPSHQHAARVPVAIPHIFHAGWYVGPSMFPWNQAQTKLAHFNKQTAIPIVLDRETTFDRFWFDVQAVNGAGPFACEMGIYDDSGRYFPGRLLFASSSINVTSAGIKTISHDFTLPPGFYWLALDVGPSGADTLDVRQATAFAYQQGWSGDPAPVFAYQTSSGGGLADPWGGTVTTHTVPLMGVRVKHYGAS